MVREVAAMARALLRPVARTLPWRALAAGAGTGLLAAWSTRMASGGQDPRLNLNLLRAAALAFALGLAFLLDDPARHTTEAVPARRPLRAGLRLALVLPLAALWWTAALLLVPEGARPPVGGATLEAAAVAALVLAGAAAAVRLSGGAEPGTVVAAGFLAFAVAVPLLLPDRWPLLVQVGSVHWDAAHARWAGALAAAVPAWAYLVMEPVRGRVPARVGGWVRRVSPAGR
ncbi:ABC transporter [Streptomyces sp. SAS_270]|uniref:ABC transporter n=1 Tax=Streptomyces sp. SAS_270 TaxID=3412748 RepID=UPI00403CDE58